MARSRTQELRDALREQQREALAPHPGDGTRTAELLTGLVELAPDFERNSAPALAPTKSLGRRIARTAAVTTVLTVAVAGAGYAGIVVGASNVEPETILVEAPAAEPQPVEEVRECNLPLTDPVVFADFAGCTPEDYAAQARIAEAERAAAEAEAARIAAEKAAAKAKKQAANEKKSSGSGSSSGTKSTSGGGDKTSKPKSEPKPHVSKSGWEFWSSGSKINISGWVETSGGTANVTVKVGGDLGTITLNGPSSVKGRGTYTGAFTGVDPGTYTLTVIVNGKTRTSANVTVG